MYGADAWVCLDYLWRGKPVPVRRSGSKKLSHVRQPHNDAEITGRGLYSRTNGSDDITCRTQRHFRQRGLQCMPNHLIVDGPRWFRVRLRHLHSGTTK